MLIDFEVSADAKDNAAAIPKLVKQALEEVGFTDRKGATLWRRTNLKYDVLMFDITPRGRCEKWGVPLGSFALEPYCYFPFLPRLGAGPNPGAVRVDKELGQIRLSFNRRLKQREVKIPNIWWAGNSIATFSQVMEDVLGQIEEKALPFFSRFEDAEELLRTLREDSNMMGREGVWNIGNEGSPIRLLLIGFAAIKCERWELARESLEASRDKFMGVPEIIRSDLLREHLPQIEQGLACVKSKCAWYESGLS